MLHVRYQSQVGDAHGHGPLEAGGAQADRRRRADPVRDDAGAGRRHPDVVSKHPDEQSRGTGAELQAQWVNARVVEHR